MLISPELAKAFNQQIGHEFGASMQYVSIAAHFSQRQLKMLAKLFFDQAEEEKQHAMKFVQYLLDTKGDLKIPAIPAPTPSFASAEEAVQAALNWEQDVTKQITSEFEKTGYIRWSTDVAKIVSEQGLKNVYGEIGTSFANSAVANPRFAAAFIGQLVNLMGPDNVVWGSDSVFYGSPQWQIEAMRRLEIPDDMFAKNKWKTKLGDADSAVKRKIFAENTARLYKYNIQAAYEGISRDPIALMKQEYEKEGVLRNNAFYGYVPKTA